MGVVFGVAKFNGKIKVVKGAANTNAEGAGVKLVEGKIFYLVTMVSLVLLVSSLSWLYELFEDRLVEHMEATNQQLAHEALEREQAQGALLMARHKLQEINTIMMSREDEILQLRDQIATARFQRRMR